MTSLLRPRKRSSPVGCGFGQVAGGEPLVFALPQCAARPGGIGDHGAAHQHFAIGPDLDFAPGQRLADGALGDMEGMIERDQRRGFGHPVSLHHHEAKRVPELLHRGGQRAASRDERPELESERAMRRRGNATIASMREMPLDPAILSANSGCVGFQVGFQQSEHAWNRGQNGNALAMDRLDQARRDKPAFEMHLGAEDTGGIQRPMVCPNTWLKGSVCRKRSGCTYFS